MVRMIQDDRDSGSMSLEVIQWKYCILKSIANINGMLKDI